MKLYEFKSSVKMPLMLLPLRSTVLQLKDRVLIISPIDFTPEQLQKIKNLGPVTDLIAPNQIHNKFIAKATLHFPGATVWGAPGLREKLPTVRWDKVLSQDPWPYEDQITTHRIQGAYKLSEVVFYCKEIKALIVTDLVFNLQNVRGFGAFLILSLFGTYRRFGVSKLIKRYINDKTSFQNSLREILKWDFEQLIMAHGEIVTSKAHEQLTEALKRRNYI